MSAPDTATPPANPAPNGPAAPPADPNAPQQQGQGQAEEQDEAGEEQDRPQDAWSSRRELADHAPPALRIGSGAGFGGALVQGDQHGVSGGRVAGDVIMGSKTEIWQLGPPAPHASGEVPAATLERLAESFVADEEAFAALADRLREERVLVVRGSAFTGRRTAALMLLRRAGATSVRSLLRDRPPAELAAQLDAEQQRAEQGRAGDAPAAGPVGYVLCDLMADRTRPLREPHLLAVRDRLAAHDGYLVVTVGPTAVLEEVDPAGWQPPSVAEVLTAHLTVHLRATAPDPATREEYAGRESARLLALPAVTGFLARDHQLREAAAFAPALARHAAGGLAADELDAFSLGALESQVREWFEEDEAALPLRDKAFLISLAAFDGGPYALTAELSDRLYAELLRTQRPHAPADVPVFGTHIGKRLQLARAERRQAEEATEWGPVRQWVAAFRDDRAALVLLRELWTGHPSARPALVRWLRALAEDGRPLVRTRAAATTAVLAHADLPSAMALLIEEWAASPRYRHRMVAAGSLALAHFVGAPNVPRVLDGWSQGEDRPMRWVAIRTHALIGPERPARTLRLLRTVVRKEYEESRREDPPAPLDEVMVEELAGAVELLLLSEARETVLGELLASYEVDRPARDLTLAGFLRACGRGAELRTDPESGLGPDPAEEEGPDEEHPHGWPLVLDWYREAAADPATAWAAHGLTRLWRAALGDSLHSRDALEVLRLWVLAAAHRQDVEWALAALLPALVAALEDALRLAHLLRTMPGEDGAPPPPVAARLLTVVPAAGHPVPQPR
ncbi:hypothetical protein [Streptomyces albidoflavus]|uniref:hypothetical protein n=1 Tax=Streptomyces albidoflavus TaxID=1886 RepID=UPI00189CB110|nr:hypothetical protein [Streptomyces albidoflavus]